jgi:aminopeptidase N
MNMIKLILLTFLLLSLSTVLHAQTKDPEPGVPRELARWRAEHYSDVHYKLNLELAPGAQMLKGSMEIRATLKEGADSIILDWRINPLKEGQSRPRVWEVTLNGKEAQGWKEANEHLIIPGAQRGENIVSLKFESPIATSGSAVTRYLDREDNSEYIYTLFVPSDASTAFPCFDQPDLKARFKLDVLAPDNWKVITNTQVSASGSIADVNETATIPKGKAGFTFQETEPISTYVFAFAAGPFVEIEDKTSSIPMRLFVRNSKAEKARKEAAEVFRLNRECLKFLARYFDYKFPFPKYDLIIVPEFAYRGMEHAGATFLREESILFPTEPTANDFLSRANVIFHEAAHQWFGDLVTMRWFDDLWLKEGFAEFMSFKALESIMPEFNAWKAFYERTKPAAYLTDATKGTTPIFQEIANLSAAKSAYGNIVYRKAPSVLRQAEFYLGPENFQKAVRSFLKKHAYANATWADLVSEFEKASGQKLDAWADAWVKRRGMPEVRAEWTVDSTNRINYFVLKQKDAICEGSTWPMRIKLLLAYKTAPPAIITVTLTGTDITSVPQVMRYHHPEYVFANYEDYGYGRFLLDQESRDYVLTHLGAEKEDFQRALLWGSLWDSVREAELAPSEYIELAIKNLGAERDEVTVQSILNRVSLAFNAYLSEAQAGEVAPRLERLLYEGMMKSEKQGLRITFFRAFQAMAMTNEARGELKKILKGELTVPGLQLRTRDRFDIITQLLARGDGDALALLEAQSKADTTDDAKRYAYAAGAAIGTAENKKKYFDAYLNDTKLAESWIEASVGPFNSIHQSALTQSYLDEALRALPQLKRTRKIFFINQWLAAFIGGQCDPRALATAQNFLKREERTLDRDLRLKVLEALDGLERCVNIKKQ